MVEGINKVLDTQENLLNEMNVGCLLDVGNGIIKGRPVLAQGPQSFEDATAQTRTRLQCNGRRHHRSKSTSQGHQRKTHRVSDCRDFPVSRYPQS